MIEILFAFSFPKPLTFSLVVSICNDSYQDSYSTTGLNVTITQDFSLPVYSFVHRYISADITYYVQMFVVLLTAIIFSNVVEAVLYYKTFSEIKR